MSLNELFDSQTPMSGDLEAGVRTIALDQKITFTLYGRIVLPIDGYVFFVRADLLSAQTFSSLVTAEQLAAIEQDGQDRGNPYRVEVEGSLHYAADARQEEAEVYAAERVILTAKDEIQHLRDVSPATMWIGEFEGMRFGFSNISSRYRQAGLWHYSGFAVYPDVGPQIIDSALQFSANQVVSNSLPAWLALSTYAPPWAFWAPPPALFPSFLIPQNQPPPFASIHIVPESTTGLASAPTIDPKTSTYTQLCRETVRVTLWGARNTNALDFVAMVDRYTLDTAAFGIMNVPVVRDEKRTQAELGVIAMKKSIEWEVSYLQQRMNDIAVQQIKMAIPSFFVDGKPA